MTRRSPIIRPFAGPPHAVSQTPGAYPPGAVRNAPPVRLPGLDGMVPYDPPSPVLAKAQEVPQLGVGDTYESYSNVFDWPGGNFASVYTTLRRWRAIDVYVENTDPAAAAATDGAFLTVYVYAVTQQGSRVLVASGRYLIATGSTQIRPQWTVAGRAVAEKYEVAINLRKPFASPIPVGRVRVTVACSDEMTEPPPFVGAITSIGSEIRWTTGGISQPPPLELCGISGVIGESAAAPRYAFVLDNNGGGGALLTDQVFVFPMGDAPGQGFENYDLRWRAVRNPRVVVSSTIATITPQLDCLIGVLVR